MTIGEKIKCYRSKSKLTQEQLAKLANISRSYLADLERNRYNPSVDTLNGIAQALNISPSLLIDVEERPSTTEVKDHDKFIETAKTLFMDDKVNEEDIEKIYKDISELYWEAKEFNKKKYGRKKDK